MYKTILTILTVTLLLSSCTDNKKGSTTLKERVHNTVKDTIQQKLKHQLFEETVYSILKAFKTKDASLVNSFVAQKHGIMIIYRTGVFNEYKYIDKINFNDPVPQNFPYPLISTNLKLKFEELPKFNCGTMDWSKYGLYCDSINKDTFLSGTPQNLIKYRGDNILQNEVEKLKDIESNSRRVVLAQQDNSFIFYLTLIDHKWYLTAIDRITTDCSA